MKERPILFSGPMVRAILEGRKTQTRRVVKPQPKAAYTEFDHFDFLGTAVFSDGLCVRTKFGVPGDRLWVRETFAEIGCIGWPIDKFEYAYRADFAHNDGNWEGYADMCFEKWKPSIFMPRAASRIMLEITNVSVERLQDITEADAMAEGVETEEIVRESGGELGYSTTSYRMEFQNLWASINGLGSWDQNPWVWVVEFKRIEP